MKIECGNSGFEITNGEITLWGDVIFRNREGDVVKLPTEIGEIVSFA